MLSLTLKLSLLALPITNNVILNTINFDLDNPAKLEYRQSADRETYINGYYWSIGYYIRPYWSARLLRTLTKREQFQTGEMIDSSSPVFMGPGPTFTMVVGGFDENEALTGEFYYHPVSLEPGLGFYTNKTSLLLAFRYDGDDGQHFGWLKLSRPDTEYTTPFTLDAYDWNPIPNAPIGAGLPPEIPVMTEVVDDGAGNPVLRVSWPGAVATWIFETTPDLTPPATWTEYPAGGTSAEVPLDGSDIHRYFRLRRP